MNSRERVLSALRHRQPDRPPIDLSGHRSSGISAIAYARLRRHLGLPERPIHIYDPMQQLAIVDEDVLTLAGADCIELGRGFALNETDWVDWELPNGTPCRLPVWALPEREGEGWVYRADDGRAFFRMPKGVLYFEQAYWPLRERDDIDCLPAMLADGMWGKMASPPGPLPDGPEGHKRLAEGARRLRQGTDRAIVGLFGGNLLETGNVLYGMDRFFLLLAADPKRVHRLLDMLVERYLVELEKFLGAVGDSIDVIFFGDDLGGQNGPLISPAMYEEFFKPRHKILWGRAKELANVKTLLHCCGGVRELLPHLIEIGLDAINPVQITCRGMDPAGLKRDFGRDIVFWGGGCDTRQALPFGTPAEVRRNVRELVRIWSPGGGFVFQQVHNILANVPPENIAAMYEALREPGD